MNTPVSTAGFTEQLSNLKQFLGDVHPYISTAQKNFHQACNQIVLDQLMGTVWASPGVFNTVHLQSRKSRQNAQQVLQILVPASRIARRLIHQLQYNPTSVDAYALSRYWLAQKGNLQAHPELSVLFRHGWTCSPDKD